MIPPSVLALSNPVFAILGVLFLAGVVYGLMARLVKVVIFFAIAAGIVWIIFIAG